MLLGPPGTKSPCKVHGSREKCHWGGRSPGPERVPGAHELLPHQVGGPGFSPRDAHQGRGGTRMEVPKDWQSPGPRRTEQGRVTIYSLDILLSRFGTSLLFHIRF